MQYTSYGNSYTVPPKIINKQDDLQQKDFDSATTPHRQYFKTLKKSCNFWSTGNLQSSQIYDYPLIMLNRALSSSKRDRATEKKRWQKWNFFSDNNILSLYLI